MNTTNSMDMINSTIKLNRLDITYFKNETIKLIREPYDNMEDLQSGILDAIRIVQRDIRILNSKMARTDKSSAKYKQYESRLNKTNLILDEFNERQQEMSLANLNQVARTGLFRSSMDRADKSIKNIISEYSKGNLNFDEFKSELNNLRDKVITEVKRLQPYKELTEVLNGRVSVGLQEFNECGKKISEFYEDSVTLFNKNIDKYIDIVEVYENESKIIVPQTQLTDPNIGLEQTDVLKQQMSAFESQSEGTNISPGEETKQSTPVRYCFGKTSMCGANPTCGGGITFA